MASLLCTSHLSGLVWVRQSRSSCGYCGAWDHLWARRSAGYLSVPGFGPTMFLWHTLGACVLVSKQRKPQGWIKQESRCITPGFWLRCLEGEGRVVCFVPSGHFGQSFWDSTGCLHNGNNCISLFHVDIVRINAFSSLITRCYRDEGIFNRFLSVLLFL